MLPSCGQQLNTRACVESCVAQGLLSVLPQLIPCDGKTLNDKTLRHTITVTVLTHTFIMCIRVSVRQPVWQSRIRTGPDFVCSDHAAQLVRPQFKWKLRPGHPAISANKQINNCKRTTVRSTTLWPVRSKQNGNWADSERFFQALLVCACEHTEGTYLRCTRKEKTQRDVKGSNWNNCACTDIMQQERRFSLRLSFAPSLRLSWKRFLTSVSRPPPQPTSRIFSPASGFPGWCTLCVFSRLSLCGKNQQKVSK